MQVSLHLCGLMGVVQKRRIILHFLRQFGINKENLFKLTIGSYYCLKLEMGGELLKM
jgi:hypothetical protein